MKPISIFGIVLATCLTTMNVHATGGCKTAGEHYKQGVAAAKGNHWQAARDAFSKSVTECDQYENWYRLGQAEQKLKNYPQAEQAFQKAREYATRDKDIYLAVARYGQTLHLQGRDSEAITLLHEARKKLKRAPGWLNRLAKKLDMKSLKKGMTVAQITRALGSGTTKTLKLETKPKVDMRLNFVSNSTSLVSDSRANLDILAEALADAALGDKKFTIIGHSDKRGPANYNMDLSMRRAKSIREMLVSKKPSLQGRLNTDGKGESQPLYPGNNKQAYLLNRRIEVTAE